MGFDAPPWSPMRPCFLNAFWTEFLFWFQNLTGQPHANDKVFLASFKTEARVYVPVLRVGWADRSQDTDTPGRLGPSWDAQEHSSLRAAPSARWEPWSWSLRLPALWILPRTCKSASSLSFSATCEKWTSTFKSASLKGTQLGAKVRLEASFFVWDRFWGWLKTKASNRA